MKLKYTKTCGAWAVILVGLALFMIPSAFAATYEVYPTSAAAVAAGHSEQTEDGPAYMVSLYAKDEGVTMNLHGGVYDFSGGRCSSTKTYTVDETTYTVTNYLTTTSVTKSRTLLAAGDGEVILKGSGRLVLSGSTTSFTIRDVTLDGFDALGGGSGKKDAACYGGAIYGDNNPGHFIASNCVFRNCRAYQGGAAMSLSCRDCVFSNNYAVADGGAVSTRGTSDKYIRRFWNCTFMNNAAGGAGGAVDAYTLQASLSDCWFENNIATNGGGGAISFATANTTSIVERCVFVSNAVYNASDTDVAGGAISSAVSPNLQILNSCFTNNSAWYGGAASCGNYSNCIFSGNCAVNFFAVKGLKISNAAADFPLRARVVDSKFIDNFQGDRFNRSHDPAGDGTFVGFAHDVRFENCEFTGGDCGFNRCSLDRCNIHDIPGTQSAYVFYQENFVSNTLVTGCSPDKSSGSLVYTHTYSPTQSGSGGMYYAGKNPGVFVNCTIADNEWRTSIICVKYASALADSFVNCVFFGNKEGTSQKKPCDLHIVKTKNQDTGVDTTFSKCAYGVLSDAQNSVFFDFTAPAFADNNYQVADPKFVGEGQGVPKYTPRRSSALVGRGDASMYSAVDVDLAGNLRLRADAGKELDIGCYQCWLEPKGFMVIFK